ncbi:hypothetical protein SAMN04515679_3225 [Pelosinus fermentans]|uniref:Uncharacterized protein n=1 Tax=Pelosinus fermentans B4 TaxID=1149862 RepID=I9LHK7_9FIRM|nr:hypothetical protein FB4_0245 [Pelosinus fermentans B4]OAM95074.1 hypothetical protein FR7_03095 [Pelosinus fermentans DSM 17108]SDR22911.1 hypothetical protein SAMN04515679_3225 [Pelosinus fermentans]
MSLVYKAHRLPYFSEYAMNRYKNNTWPLEKEAMRAKDSTR